MEYQPLNAQINVRMTDEDRGKLWEVATAAGMSASEWLRSRIDEAYQQLISDGHIPAEKEPQA